MRARHTWPMQQDDERTSVDRVPVDGGAADAERPEAIARFWALAQVRARTNPSGVVTGQNTAEALLPPAWSFGDDPAQADALVDLVLEGRKTATASAAVEYAAADEPLPRPGELSIVLDGSGRPRALIRVTDVRVVRLGDVDAEHARLEGEGDGSLEAWRRAHDAFLRATLPADVAVDDDLEVVLERFALVYPVG